MAMFNRFVAMRHFSSAAEKVKFTVVGNDDVKYEVETDVGKNLLQAGLAVDIPFQVACGGNGECCTCHVFLNSHIQRDPDYQEPEEAEQDSLDWSNGTNEFSRLSCQTKVTKSFHGQTIKWHEFDN